MRRLAATAALIASSLLAVAPNPLSAFPVVNTFTVCGPVTGVIIQGSTRIGFTVTDGEEDLLIPCPQVDPQAGCEQVEFGDFVKVEGHLFRYEAAGDGTLYTSLAIDEMWRCTTEGEVKVCVLLPIIP